MKSVLSVLICIFLLASFNYANASDNGCEKLVVNLKKGRLNKTKPTASQDEIKSMFPCFTGSTEEGGAFNCGGGVFFLDHDFYFYTARDYLEIRSGFKGTVKGDWLKKSASDLTKTFGDPVREEVYGEKTIRFYKTKYGCLRFVVVNDEIIEIGIHYQPAKDVELCM